MKTKAVILPVQGHRRRRRHGVHRRGRDPKAEAGEAAVLGAVAVSLQVVAGRSHHGLQEERAEGGTQRRRQRRRRRMRLWYERRPRCRYGEGQPWASGGKNGDRDPEAAAGLAEEDVVVVIATDAVIVARRMRCGLPGREWCKSEAKAEAEPTSKIFFLGWERAEMAPLC